MKLKIVIIIALIGSMVQIGNSQSNFVGSGLALNFDGNSDNYYDLGDNYNTLNFPLTFEAWVNQSEYSLYTPVFASDSYTSGNYYGFYIRFDPVGKLIFEIGNGVGAGGAHRRGKITTSAVPLNEWVHIAIVASSVTDIKFYFNGVLKAAVSTDGTASNTSIVHNSNTVNLGRYATVHRSDAFIGQIDEVRLWNIARTEFEIRDKMCEKLTLAETGLVGYWIVDENTPATTLQDYSISGANGNEIGSVEKSNSGAPIGNASVFTYLADYSGATLSLNSLIGDKLKLNKILGSPYGIHLYRVDSYPNGDNGLLTSPDVYYGVFPVDNAVDATYTMAYTYAYSNGVSTVDNEDNSKLFKRLDGTIDTWVNQPAMLNIAGKKLTKKNFVGRTEIILNILNPNGRLNIPTSDLIAEEPILVYPVPADELISITNVQKGSLIQIYDFNGRIVFSTICENEYLHVNISQYEPGLYFIKENSTSGSSVTKFQKI